MSLAQTKTRHVYYSVTTDNPFLPEEYVRQLLKDLDPKQAQRMVYGQWVPITEEVVYYEYGPHNFRSYPYEVSEKQPIHMDWDFNIGLGKPLSACFHQWDQQGIHFFDEVIVEGARTESALEEMAGRGLLDWDTEYRIHGDATGYKRDTRSVLSDYDIIRKFLANYKPKHGKPFQFMLEVPASNPPLRARHNYMNGLMRNALGEVRLFVYSKARTLDEGFRLTALRRGADYVEDDSKAYQHVTTAAGYGAWWEKLAAAQSSQGTREI